jgi:hypothetical protein
MRDLFHPPGEHAGPSILTEDNLHFILFLGYTLRICSESVCLKFAECDVCFHDDLDFGIVSFILKMQLLCFRPSSIVLFLNKTIIVLIYYCN